MPISVAAVYNAPFAREKYFPTALAKAKAVGKYFSRAKGALYTAATLMGISRIYLCVHYPTDVIFGAALGIFFGIASFTLTQKAGEKI